MESYRRSLFFSFVLDNLVDSMLVISRTIKIPDRELKFSAIRAQGAGGQNVNKVSTAIQLRFDIPSSTLPDHIKHRLLTCGDSRITRDGSIVIKAQEFRSQRRNKDAALERLEMLLRAVSVNRRHRIATLPTRRSAERRLENKTRRGRLKRLRLKQTVLKPDNGKYE